MITGQTVSKINLDGDNVAKSVDVSRVCIGDRTIWLTDLQFVPRNATTGNGATCIQACREVILAAGAPRSPQVLQLSGIGPKKLLSQYGIKTLVDLPGVGQNFQDQPSMFMQFTCKLS